MKKTKIFNLVTIIALLATVMCTFLFIPGCKEEDANETAFHVSTKGSDNNPGTKRKPFATPEKAIQAVRDAVSKGLDKPVTVYFHEGEYQTEGIEFTDADSGTKEFPVTYKAYNDEAVTLTGGITLKNKDFVKIQDETVLSRLKDNVKDKVKAIDLKKYGITKDMIGPVYATGVYNQGDAPSGSNIGLSWNDIGLELARYPNDGYLLVDSVIDNGDSFKKIPGTIKMDEETRKLVSTWKELDDVWTFGFWTFNWADNTTPVDVWDIEKGTMKFKYSYSFGYEAGKRYYFYNVFEELDAPGEYYIDRENLIAYVYPPEGVENKDALISLGENPIIRGNNVSNVSFEGLRIAGSRSDGINIRNSNNITVKNCIVTNVNGNGIAINGSENKVLDSEISYTGRGGVRLDGGGNPGELIYANNLIENNYIHHFQRIQKTYAQGAWIGDIGSRMAHNEIAYAPHTALGYSGPENIVEYNYIHDVVTDSDDAGALYVGGSWGACGTQIRYNYFLRIGMPGVGGRGIYLDDGMSGAIVHGNICEEVYGIGINAGGGKFNTITNNLLINCYHGVSYDDRYAEGGMYYPSNAPYVIYELTLEYMTNKEVWKKKYPKLFKIVTDDSKKDDIYWVGNPSHAVVKNNIAVECKTSYVIVDNVYDCSGSPNNIEHNCSYDARDEILENDAYNVLKQKAPDNWTNLPKEKMGRYSETNPRE